MTEKNIVSSDEGMYRLFSRENGNLFLGVLCGGIGMYEVKVPLNEDEKESFRTRDGEFLDQLAEDIRNQPDKYKDRWVE